MNQGVVVGVAAAILLAGCSGGGSEGAGDGAGTSNAGVTGTAGFALPTWTVGEWWSYLVEVGSGGAGAPTTYAITGEQGADWIMDTDSLERAFQDAREDISRLGPQRKSDLAGSQGSDRVEFFHWPMLSGANWTTRWDHQQVTVRVQSVDLATNTARLMAHNETQMVYDYTYDASVGWFQKLTRFGPDGSPAVSLTLDQHGENWTGTGVRYALDTLASVTPASQGSGPAAFQGVPNLDVVDGTADLWMTYQIPCVQGTYSVTLRPNSDPADSGYEVNAQCDAPVTFSGVVIDAPAAGEWTLTVSYATTPGMASLAYELLARTIVPVPVTR